MDTSPLLALLEELEGYMPKIEKIAPQVSDKDIAWHFAHSVKVIQVSLQSLLTSDSKQYRSAFSLSKSIIMAMGWIPRGLGKAPKVTKPEKTEVTQEQLQSGLEDLRMTIASLAAKSQENSYMKHPYFGMLNREETLKFLGIHTRHHLKIIKEINDKAWEKPSS